MGKINWGGVVLCGLLAGVVLNVIDYVLYGVLLAKDYDAALQALGKQSMSMGLILWFVFLDFIYGIGLIWLYAAIRPRFNPGPQTAVIAGLALWFFIAFLHTLGEAPLQLFPHRLYVIGTVVALVEYPVAAAVGAYAYKEA